MPVATAAPCRSICELPQLALTACRRTANVLACAPPRAGWAVCGEQPTSRQSSEHPSLCLQSTCQRLQYLLCSPAHSVYLPCHADSRSQVRPPSLPLKQRSTAVATKNTCPRHLVAAISCRREGLGSLYLHPCTASAAPAGSASRSGRTASDSAESTGACNGEIGWQGRHETARRYLSPWHGTRCIDRREEYVRVRLPRFCHGHTHVLIKARTQATSPMWLTRRAAESKSPVSAR